MANLGDLGNIISYNPRFQSRVAAAMAVAATSVYSESAFAATSASSAASSKTLTFTSVPSWVTAGGGVVDSSNDTNTIPTGAIITAVTSTTVTINVPIGSAGVASGDTITFTQHAVRAQFATRVSELQYNLQAAAYVVLSNSTISAEAVATTTPDYAIADADIQFAVNSNWNLMAGA